VLSLLVAALQKASYNKDVLGNKDALGNEDILGNEVFWEGVPGRTVYRLIIPSTKTIQPTEIDLAERQSTWCNSAADTVACK